MRRRRGRFVTNWPPTPAVARVTLITADAALAEFEKFSGVSDALAHLDRNPLPASLRLLLKDGHVRGTVRCVCNRSSVAHRR